MIDSHNKTGGRTTSRQRMLARLRDQIVKGRFAPGARLPSRSELERQFGASPVTVQHVFDQLSREGFVVARRRLGTFVSDEPPHLCSFVLVFPYRDLPERPWPRFWHALAAEARKLQRPGVRIGFSYGNETHVDIDAYRHLLDDVAHHRLAGLLFASKPFYLRGSPVLAQPGLPCVAIMPSVEADMPGIKAVSHGGDWLGLAIDQLLAAGRRRIAVLTLPAMADLVASTLAARGLKIPAYWVQPVHPQSCAGARRVTHLLLAGDAVSRPDGLLITDDNLVEAATAGVADAGVKVPGRLLVGAHCNFPYPAPSAVPVVQVGYDVRKLLNVCLDNLILQRQGGAVPDVSHIMPCFGAGTPRGAK